MKAEIEINAEQFAALERSRMAAFPDESTRPTLGQYITEGAQAKLNEHVAAWRQRDLDNVKSELQKKIEQLSADDLATVLSVAQKYNPPEPELPQGPQEEAPTQ